MEVKYVGNGDVVLISGGGKIYTDIAARFCRSERDLKDIIGSPYDKRIVENILNSNHLAATEFDYFIFGIQGYSRVTEAQLIRKRIASYLISSGRIEKNNKRKFSVVIPKNIEDIKSHIEVESVDDIMVLDNDNYIPIRNYYPAVSKDNKYIIVVDTLSILKAIEYWYTNAINENIPEEEARYLKPQATEFKAIVGMNARALIDWFKIRCCQNAQTEIRDLAYKMLKLCKNVAPDLFKDVGASCVSLGYCPENKRQNSKCKNKILTHDDVLELIKKEKTTKNIEIQKPNDDPVDLSNGKLIYNNKPFFYDNWK